MKPIFSKDYSLQLRLVLAIIIAITAILADSQLETFVKIRTYMDTVVSPLCFLAHTPQQMFNSISHIFITNSKIVLENQILRQQLLLKSSEQLLLSQYKQENTELRELLKSTLKYNEQKMVTQIISTSMNPYSNQVVIDKGQNHGVYIGQPVISDKGIVGQVIATSKITSRVLLICDTSHALPIRVLRNDIHLIITGNSCTKDLQLEHILGSVDIRVGDMLVSSGLGGRFPEGYPVAIVSSVKIDIQQAITIIQARPTANLRNLRFLLLLWNIDSESKKPILPNAIPQYFQ